MALSYGNTDEMIPGSIRNGFGLGEGGEIEAQMFNSANRAAAPKVKVD